MLRPVVMPEILVGGPRGRRSRYRVQALVTQEYGALGDVNVGDLGHDD